MHSFALGLSLGFIALQLTVILSSLEILVEEPGVAGVDVSCDGCQEEFDPNSALVRCDYVPREFILCGADIGSPPVFLDGNTTEKQLLGHGCTRWGGQRYEDVERTRVHCSVLQGIECWGDRTFLSHHTEPCIKYNGHYFVTTLIYSVLLGFLGMDRFCLGWTGTAVGKLLTLGGVGIWWVVDIVLLATGDLRPADESNWVPVY